QNPAAEAKLHAELDEVLVGRAPSIDDLARLPYTANVITESMRLYPPAWGLARVAIEDHELGGYPVRKGMGVAMAQWVVQRDTRWYDKPEEFRPERWEGDFAKRSEERRVGKECRYRGWPCEKRKYDRRE